MSDELRKQFDSYIGSLFVQDDAVLQWIRDEIERHEMPTISVEPFDGYLLQWLVRLVDAKNVLEIGTLGGYSGTWIARALPEDGKLTTLELEEKHAQVAQAAFDKAGVSDKVQIIVGAALESLKKLSGPVDMVFIDADKESYPHYLEWAIANLREGGLIAAHNAFRSGRVLAPEEESDMMMDAFNRKLASTPGIDGMIIPLGDGMAVGIKRHKQ